MKLSVLFWASVAVSLQLSAADDEVSGEEAPGLHHKALTAIIRLTLGACFDAQLAPLFTR
jgi:hypothetical protein